MNKELERKLGIIGQSVLDNCREPGIQALGLAIQRREPLFEVEFFALYWWLRLKGWAFSAKTLAEAHPEFAAKLPNG